MARGTSTRTASRAAAWSSSTCPTTWPVGGTTSRARSATSGTSGSTWTRARRPRAAARNPPALRRFGGDFLPHDRESIRDHLRDHRAKDAERLVLPRLALYV